MASIDNLLVSLFADEILGGFFVIVPPGHIACIYSIFRGVLKEVWHPGIHFKLPLIHRVKLFNAQIIEYTISKDIKIEDNKEVMGDEVIEAVSSDNKFIKIEATALIQIDTTKITEIWQNIGENFISKVVRPVTRSRIRRVLARFTVEDSISASRSKIEDEIKDQLFQALQPHGLKVKNFYLSSLTPVEPLPAKSEAPKKFIASHPKKESVKTGTVFDSNSQK